MDVRDQVWDGILDTDQMMRYYGMLSDKLRRKHSWLTWTTVLAAATAIVPLVVNFPTWISILAFAVVAGATLWAIHSNYPSKATAAMLFSEQYGQLSTEWRRLWFGNPTFEDVAALRDRYTRVPAGYEVETDEGLNEKAQREAYAIIPREFGSSRNEESSAASSA